jgi:hypothetical protein
MGISLRHSVHFFVVGSTGGSFLERDISKFIGLTMKKKTDPDINKKDIKELIK